MKKNQDKKLTVLFISLVILIFAFALFLRMYNLGKFSMWVDESYHLYVSQSLNENGSMKLPSGHEYGRAKLFSYLTALSTKIFGLNEFGLRFPTALFGFLSLLIFFIFTRKLLGNSIAIVALILLAVLPLEVGWARVTRFYTLFQFFTILVWYSFYTGFIKRNSFLSKPDLHSRISIESIIRSWEINWFYLFLFFIFLICAVSVQVIGVFPLLAIFVFLVMCSIYTYFKADITRFLLSKYFIFTVAAILFFTPFLLFNQVRATIEYGIDYIPAFAKNPGAMDRMKYMKFIMGKGIFPLGVFFIIGLLQSLFRLNKVIVYSALFFIVQVFLFTFVFAYRADQYIYNVLPFFILVASYSIVTIIRHEKEKFKNGKNFIYQFIGSHLKEPFRLVYVLFILLLFSTPFFIEGISAPFHKVGESNGAIIFSEWKEAAEFVNKKEIESKIILTTLPLTVKYYLGKVDYNLNLSDVEVAQINSTTDSNGRLYDFYSGIYFIETAAELDSLVQNTTAGYIIVDTYRLIHSFYITRDVSQYMDKNLTLDYITPKQTIRVYSWDNL